MNIVQLEVIPGHAELLAIAQRADAKHLHLITNGERSVLCSIIPNGWRAMRVMQKSNHGKAA